MVYYHNYHEEKDLLDLLMQETQNGVPYFMINRTLCKKECKELYREILSQAATYDVFKDIPRLPKNTYATFDLHSEWALIGLVSTLRSTEGTNIRINLIDPTALYIKSDHGEYDCNESFERPEVFKYLAEKIVKGSLVVDELILPRYVFSENQNQEKRSLLKEKYSQQLNRLIFYSFREVLRTEEEYIRCFAIDVSEVYK